MLKSLLMASALTMAFSGAAMADDTPAPAAGCTGCSASISNSGAPVKMAQVRIPRDLGPAINLHPRDWNSEMPRNPVSCCDPVLASFADPAKINQIFAYDLDPAGGLSANYGIKFQPDAAFKTAVNNSAFIANVMMQLPYSHFIIRAQMRTDNQPNKAWPSAGKAHLYNIVWNATNNLQWNHNLYVEDSPPALLGSPPSQPFSRTNMATSHMTANGVRYIAKLTYWVAYTDPVTGEWVAREITCSNVPSIYVASNINPAPFKTGAGYSPKIEVELGKPGSNQDSLGAPVKLTPQEVKDMGLRRS